MPVSPDDTLTARLVASGLLDEAELAELRPADGATEPFVERLVRDGRLTSFQAEALRTGRPLVLGEYRLVDRLGVGGMGEVFRAVHRRMDRVVALKILADRMLEAPNALARFEREVRAAARLVHPNVVTAYDAGEQDGVHFLVTEFVDGPDLKTYVVAHGPLNVPEAVDVLRQAAEGLGYAHGEGIVHRDVKPSNLLVDGRGRVKVLDMGIARIETPEPAREESDLTGTGTVMGTLDYMSPEQALQTRDADARADLYSLGCTLHFLLTGSPPYRGETAMQRLVAHREQPVPSLAALVPEVPAQLDAVHSRLLAKRVEDRFQSADELLAALAPLASRTVSPPVVERPSPPPRTAPAPTLATGSSIVADDRTRLASDPHTVTTRTLGEPIEPRMTGGPTSESSNAAFRTRWAIVAGACALLLAVGLWFVFGGGDDPPPGLPTGPNRALRFDGRSAYVHVPSLDITEHESFTVEFWMVIEEPRLGNIVNWFGPGWFTVYTNPPNIGVGKLDSTDRPLAVAALDPSFVGRAVHVAATWDGREKRLFLDGRPIELRPTGYVPLPTESGFYIGGAPPEALPENEEDRWFSGIVDEVRVSSGVRYLRQFDPIRRPPADERTIALYRFDEASGDIARDASGNAHEGRIVAARRVETP